MAAPYAVVVCLERVGSRRFLMVRHRRRGWELPGGRLEPGESGVEAARREFAEETARELVDARQLLVQEKPNGRCHVVVGVWGPPTQRAVREEEAIQEARFVDALEDVQPLAFPDDPYEAIETALGWRIRRKTV